MIYHWIVLDLYAYDLHKNAEKARVISFLSQILCQKAVPNRHSSVAVQYCNTILSIAFEHGLAEQLRSNLLQLQVQTILFLTGLPISSHREIMTL